MTHKIFSLSVAIVILAFLSAGCSKKVTKIQTSPEKTQPAIEQNVSNNTRAQDMISRADEVLVPIYFDYDKSNILNSELLKLEQIAAFLNENSQYQLMIEGHCDERGSSEYNIGLGEKRARTVNKWLIAYGISNSQLKITSFGKERPAAANCEYDDCHSQNRRVEWKVLVK
jgi:peptidoglycan-associated lipoprotein